MSDIGGAARCLSFFVLYGEAACLHSWQRPLPDIKHEGSNLEFLFLKKGGRMIYDSPRWPCTLPPNTQVHRLALRDFFADSNAIPESLFCRGVFFCGTPSFGFHVMGSMFRMERAPAEGVGFVRCSFKPPLLRIKMPLCLPQAHAQLLPSTARVIRQVPGSRWPADLLRFWVMTGPLLRADPQS